MCSPVRLPACLPAHSDDSPASPHTNHPYATRSLSTHQHALPPRLPGWPPACSLFQYVREMQQLAEPTLTVAYLQGSNRLLAAACGLADTECA